MVSTTIGQQFLLFHVTLNYSCLQTMFSIHALTSIRAEYCRHHIPDTKTKTKKQTNQNHTTYLCDNRRLEWEKVKITTKKQKKQKKLF